MKTGDLPHSETVGPLGLAFEAISRAMCGRLAGEHRKVNDMEETNNTKEVRAKSRFSRLLMRTVFRFYTEVDYDDAALLSLAVQSMSLYVFNNGGFCALEAADLEDVFAACKADTIRHFRRMEAIQNKINAHKQVVH
jgi:hypothetical protein